MRNVWAALILALLAGCGTATPTPPPYVPTTSPAQTSAAAAQRPNIRVDWTKRPGVKNRIDAHGDRKYCSGLEDELDRAWKVRDRMVIAYVEAWMRQTGLCPNINYQETR